MENSNLRSQTISGLRWTFLENVLRYGISFIVSIILARLLSPEEYGLIGIILIFTSVFSAIVDSGFSTAIIKNNNAKEIDYIPRKNSRSWWS